MTKILPHGMSSEKASRVKKRGHNKEYLFADLIGGEAIKGTNKIDVKDKNGNLFTIKGGSEVKGKSGTDGRWQLFLFSKSRFLKDENFPLREYFIKILNCFPKTRDEYDLKPNYYKELVKKPMSELKEILNKDNNIEQFFSKAIFNFIIDYLVIYDNDIFHVFEKSDVLSAFKNQLIISNSSTFQKVVFLYNEKIAIEIEVRKSKGKFPSILLITNKRKILSILLDKFNNYEEKKRNIFAYGAAKNSFKI